MVLEKKCFPEYQAQYPAGPGPCFNAAEAWLAKQDFRHSAADAYTG